VIHPPLPSAKAVGRVVEAAVEHAPAVAQGAAPRFVLKAAGAGVLHASAVVLAEAPRFVLLRQAEARRFVLLRPVAVLQFVLLLQAVGLRSGPQQ
jgi:hypothetical protein